jgi:flagellar hook-basal body complex protein FliE
MTDAVASVLAQIRSLQSQLRPESVATEAAARGTNFAETLQNSQRLVNERSEATAATRGTSFAETSQNALRNINERPDTYSTPARGPGFVATLQSTLRQVNETQMESARLAQAFEMGDPRADLVKVMLASQESQVAFRAVVEVRNRLVQAYQDVMNMPL